MKKAFIWILRIIPALIMLQTLYFKFSASPESVYIFTKMGIEPWGRIASGVTELIAGILLLIPRTTLLGALMGAGVIAGAIASHIFVLGIEVMNDGGQLFIYAVVTFIACAALIIIERKRIPNLLKLQF
jgi:uncharacterized membrane protein YphA (DoxX/SURF4 family)